MEERIQKLIKRKQTAYKEDMYALLKKVRERVFTEEKHRPLLVRCAKSITAFLQEKEICMEPYDLLAGYQQTYDQSSVIPKSILYETDDLELREDISFFKKGLTVGLFEEGMGGHFVPDFTGVLSQGIHKRTSLARELWHKAEDNKKDFYESQVILGEGIKDFINRYGAKAAELSEESNDQVLKKELTRIALACRKIAQEPPETFFEALQLFWFLHEILIIEQGGAAISPGRFDQYLYPYYKKDLEQGKITREEAYELIRVLWLKFNEIRNGEATLFYQNILLGGQLADGTDAVNELSFLCLEATKTLPFHQPNLSVRFCDKTNPDFINAVVSTIANGNGMPSIFNDSIIIASKIKLGVSQEDAIHYAIIGCVEQTIPGREFSHTEGGRINLAKIIELMLNQGKCPLTGIDIKLKNEYSGEWGSFEDFYQDFQEELARFIDISCKVIDKLSRDFCQYMPYPYASFMMKDCLETGRDVTNKGVKYNFLSINGIGLANTVDSLLAIKQLVFEEKKLDFTSFRKILTDNFKDNERLRQYILHKIPKFGNDIDNADELAAKIADFFCRTMMKHKNSKGDVFQPGLHSVYSHSTLGENTGTLPDGRLKGISLASSLSPAQGRDQSGPTAVINSLTKLDHSFIGNGMVLDMKFHPHIIKNDGLAKLRDMILTYLDKGGMEIQFNIIDSKTLIQAQRNPEQYAGLIVRVSGFSAHFTQLSKVLQDEIIARTELSFTL